MIDKGEKFTLLDCRGVDYYNWGHLPGAVNLRWKYVQERAEKMFTDKNATIVTYCDGIMCSVSIRCYNELKKLGYKNLLEYWGGVTDWQAHGNKVIEVKDYKIAPNIYRFPNQIFAGEQVGSYLIEEKDFILLIDGPQQLGDDQEDFIITFDKPIKVFMTHDPTAGGSIELQKKYRAKFYLHKDDKNGQYLKLKPDVFIKDGYKFADHLRVVHVPGHTPGSSVLVDTKNKVLFTGDAVEGNAQGEIGELSGPRADTKQMFKSIKKLLKYEFNAILPFHYEMIRSNAKEKLLTFIQNNENNNR